MATTANGSALQDRTPTGSNFAFAGPMTESILLGNVALRVGKRSNMTQAYDLPGSPEADQYIRYDTARAGHCKAELLPNYRPCVTNRMVFWLTT